MTSNGRDSLLDGVRQAGRHVQRVFVNSSEFCKHPEAFKGMIAALASSPGVLSSVLMENCHSMLKLALFTSIQILAL